MTIFEQHLHRYDNKSLSKPARKPVFIIYDRHDEVWLDAYKKNEQLPFRKSRCSVRPFHW